MKIYIYQIYHYTKYIFLKSTFECLFHYLLLLSIYLKCRPTL